MRARPELFLFALDPSRPILEAFFFGICLVGLAVVSLGPTKS